RSAMTGSGGLVAIDLLVDPASLVGRLAARVVDAAMERVACVLDGVLGPIARVRGLVAERLAVGLAPFFLDVRLGVPSGLLDVIHRSLPPFGSSRLRRSPYRRRPTAAPGTDDVRLQPDDSAALAAKEEP